MALRLENGLAWNNHIGSTYRLFAIHGLHPETSVGFWKSLQGDRPRPAQDSTQGNQTESGIRIFSSFLQFWNKCNKCKWGPQEAQTEGFRYPLHKAFSTYMGSRQAMGQEVQTASYFLLISAEAAGHNWFKEKQHNPSPTDSKNDISVCYRSPS